MAKTIFPAFIRLHKKEIEMIGDTLYRPCAWDIMYHSEKNTVQNNTLMLCNILGAEPFNAPTIEIAHFIAKKIEEGKIEYLSDSFDFFEIWDASTLHYTDRIGKPLCKEEKPLPSDFLYVCSNDPIRILDTTGDFVSYLHPGAILLPAQSVHPSPTRTVFIWR